MAVDNREITIYSGFMCNGLIQQEWELKGLCQRFSGRSGFSEWISETGLGDTIHMV